MPEAGTPELRAARAELRKHLGAQVAEKATDAFCLTLYDQITGPVDPLGTESLALSDDAPAGLAILEFETPPSIKDLRSTPLSSERVAGLDGAILPGNLLLREELIRVDREQAYRVMGGVFERLQSLTSRCSNNIVNLTNAPEATRSYGRQQYWINRTIETFSEPKVIADVADDHAIKHIDVPHVATQEERAAHHKTIRLPDYLQEFPATGEGVVIAVIDGEVNYETLGHAVAIRRNLTHKGWGFPDKHGTAVAGIAAAAFPPMGVAPGATIYNYKVFPEKSTALDLDVVLALQHALEDGAHIANLSLGTGGISEFPSREAVAASRAWQLGMILVKSAGNKGPMASTMTRPAEASEILVVGATDLRALRVAQYSSRGPHFSRLGPDVVAPGEGMLSHPAGYVARGTSFAAPHVAGLAALFLEQNSNQSANQIRSRIRGSSSRLPNCAPTAQGLGVIQAM